MAMKKLWMLKNGRANGVQDRIAGREEWCVFTDCPRKGSGPDRVGVNVSIWGQQRNALREWARQVGIVAFMV